MMYKAVRHIILVLLLSFAYISPNIAKKEVRKTTTGTIHSIYPVLLVEFEDLRFTTEDPKGSFSRMFNGRDYNHNGSTGSVVEWLAANFKEKASFAFEVSDVITLPGTLAAYGAQGAHSNDSDVLGMLKDACAAAIGAGVDFSRYDNDGDGLVDNLAVIYAGYSQAEGGSGDSIWPHQQDMGEGGFDCNGVGIASYTCNAELSGNSGTEMAPIGHFCHEFSHYLGLQDLYDINGEAEGAAPATYGSLSIMDKGNFLNSGKTPPLYNAAEREILGLCTIEELLPDKSYILEPSSRSDRIYRINTSNEGEYFLLECREASGWDAHIGGSGLVVYHIDKSSGVYGGIASADRWRFNNINCFAGHECLRVISAAGKTDDVGKVFFPGSAGVTELLPSGRGMALTDWAGHPVGVGIVDITYSQGKVSFRTVKELSFDPSLPMAIEIGAYPYQRDIRVEWSAPGVDIDDQRQLQWLVKWREKGSGKDFSSKDVEGNVCYLDDVLPGCEYEIQVCALKDGIFGEGRKIFAKTLPITSLFPYIYVGKGGYQAGKVMDLRVVNLVEKHISVDWYVNGMPVDGESVLLEDVGEMEIMAVIVYSDGSNEKIYKRISVR